MFHKSKFGEDSWDDIFRSKSLGSRSGFQAQPRIPGRFIGPKTNQNQAYKSRKSENQNVNEPHRGWPDTKVAAL
jgi:hypothetical protein